MEQTDDDDGNRREEAAEESRGKGRPARVVDCQLRDGLLYEKADHAHG